MILFKFFVTCWVISASLSKSKYLQQQKQAVKRLSKLAQMSAVGWCLEDSMAQTVLAAHKPILQHHLNIASENKAGHWAADTSRSLQHCLGG